MPVMIIARLITAKNCELLPRRGAQAVPGVSHLMVMHFRQIVRRIER